MIFFYMYWYKAQITHIIANIFYSICKTEVAVGGSAVGDPERTVQDFDYAAFIRNRVAVFRIIATFIRIREQKSSNLIVILRNDQLLGWRLCKRSFPMVDLRVVLILFITHS